MNPARFRSRVARRVCVAGFHSKIPIRPLSRTELLAIDNRISEDWSESSIWRDLAERVAVLTAATGIADIAEECSTREVSALFAAWEEVQSDHMPDVDRLDAETELQLVDGYGLLLLDATAAGHSESPADFYGEPAGSLSDGQLAYYLTLKAAHTRWSESDGRKCRSLKMLRKRAGRSESTNPRGAA